MSGIKIDFTKRIYGFDLLRAFAIFSVVHRHGRHLLRGTFLEGPSWLQIPHGVDIFFVLSGFLIGYSLIANASKTNDRLTFSKSTNFWKRAIFRILPNYYLLLAVNYMFVEHSVLTGSTEKFSIWKYVTFTQNLYYPFYDFFWESWSLATQTWFYLLFPILLMVLGRYVRLKYNVLIVSSGFILSAIIYRFSISDVSYDAFWWDVNFRKVAISRIDCIYWGVLAAWGRFYYNKIWNKYAIPFGVLGVLIFIVTSFIPRELNSVYLNIFYLSISPIYISLIFPILDRLKDTKTLFGNFVTRISILSYAIYLLNLLIIQITDNHFGSVLMENGEIKYIIYWIVTLVLSYLLYMVFENPISTYGNRIMHTTKMMYKRLS